LNPAAANFGLMSRSVDRSGSLEGESFSTASTPIAVTHAPIQQDPDPRFASVPVDDANAMDFDGLDEDLCSLNFDLLDTQTAEALLANEDDYAAGEFTEQVKSSTISQ
jgi:hypothetical protein